MKTIAMVVLMVLLASPLVVLSQDTLELSGLRAKGVQSSWSINLPNANKKLVQRVWADYARSHFNSRPKYDRKAKEFVAEGAQVSEISGYPIDLVSRTTQMGNSVQFLLQVDMQGAMLERSISPRRAAGTDLILEDFAREVEREKVRLHLKDEEKNMRKLEYELKALKNANIRYHREIEFAEERIKRAKENIIKNEKDQEAAVRRIENQIKVLEAVKRQLQSI